MNPIQSTPSVEQVNQRAVKVRQLCQRADAEIVVLDDLIARLQDEERSSRLHHYHLNKAKLFLEHSV
ncbi:MAG: hypothetical protein F6K30_12000 [Cyanothece sp. SIO2G6]|nr:hypothetical protein [Cyanothece sp. SIO2G6]